MQVRLQQFSPKLLVAFFLVLAAVFAQDSVSYLTPGVSRVGARLACRCGGCRNTVGDCPMLRCSSADPMRHRIYSMQQKGMSDDAIVNSIVQQEGIVALASPPTAGLGPIVTWVMPGLVLVLGFFVYSAFVRRNRQSPAPLTPVDESLIARFRHQMDSELEDDPASEEHPGSRR